MWKSYTTEFSLMGLQEPSTGLWSELYDRSMPSHHIVLRFSWIFSYCLCLGLPSGVLIWGHCVLEIQRVNVCLYWNSYYVATSRAIFGGIYAISWECYTLCLRWLSNWDLFVPLDKTRCCLGPSTCYSDTIISFCKLACPQHYKAFWWFCQFFSQIASSCLIHSTSYSARFVTLPRQIPSRFLVHSATSHFQWRTQEFCSGVGSANSVEDRGQRERASAGGRPLFRGSGGSCNLVQEISFHIVKFS